MIRLSPRETRPSPPPASCPLGTISWASASLPQRESRPNRAPWGTAGRLVDERLAQPRTTAPSRVKTRTLRLTRDAETRTTASSTMQSRPLPGALPLQKRSGSGPDTRPGGTFIEEVADAAPPVLRPLRAAPSRLSLACHASLVRPRPGACATADQADRNSVLAGVPVGQPLPESPHIPGNRRTSTAITTTTGRPTAALQAETARNAATPHTRGRWFEPSRGHREEPASAPFHAVQRFGRLVLGLQHCAEQLLDRASSNIAGIVRSDASPADKRIHQRAAAMTSKLATSNTALGSLAHTIVGVEPRRLCLAVGSANGEPPNQPPRREGPFTRPAPRGNAVTSGHGARFAEIVWRPRLLRRRPARWADELVESRVELHDGVTS